MATAAVQPVRTTAEAFVSSDAFVPSHERVEYGSVNIPVGSLPASTASPTTDVGKVAEELIGSFNTALSKKDYGSLVNLFLDNCYWRDHLALSWEPRTLKGKEKISQYLSKGCSLLNVAIDKTSPFRTPHMGAIDGFGDVIGVEHFITFETEVGTGRGVVRLADDNGRWKIFSLFTSLQELKGHEEPLGPRRSKGVEHGGKPDRKNWQERRIAEINYEGTNPTVMILGAGQGGLTAAARLKMLGVDTLIVDKAERVGDNWRQRYRQLVLHDPVWIDHLPYINFPAHWPIFTPKDKLAEFFEFYVKALELNVWTKTNMTSSSWDETKKEWTITLERTKEDGTTETRVIHPRHVIQATGHSGKKNVPDIKGMQNFKGDRLCHSSEFSGARLDAKGKKALIVGCCNSAHDIAQDFCEKGYDVTMVQRSSTLVITSESIVKIGLKGLYDEDGPPVEDADLWLMGMPSEILKAQQVKVTKVQSQNDAKLLEGLEKAGFRTDRGPSGAGLFMKYFQRGGGYYIDVGASQLIVDGKVKIKHGQEITEVLTRGLRFTDGTELEADEIIFATGYQNMRTQARITFGDELADRVGDVWGFDQEGEMRTIWRRSGHPGFWFMGGNLAFARYYSKILALQIKASIEGIAS